MNKGAEAMLYIAVNECLNRYPNCVCTIQLSDGFYDVDSLAALYQLSLSRKKEVNGKLSKLRTMISAYRKAELMLDVSGYELCSKLGMYPSMRYIFKIALSKWVCTTVVLMPQSFGPFQYSGIVGKVLRVGIRHYMQYPLICFTREKQSEEQLLFLAPKARVCSSPDLVLQNRRIMDAVKMVVPLDKIRDIVPGSIALVVNRRLYEQYGKERILSKYEQILRKAVEKERNVYLLCHATDDLDICTALKEKFSEEPCIHVVEQVLSCFEFQELVRKFDYVIAARYHSIVHSYKEGIPCIALGWAVKYQELLEAMGQKCYLLDIGNAQVNEICATIDRMEQNFHIEKLVIREHVVLVQQENCFDKMAAVITEEQR